MKILLIGKTEQLGADIARTNAKHELYAPDLMVLDIRSRDSSTTVLSDYQPIEDDFLRLLHDTTIISRLG